MSKTAELDGVYPGWWDTLDPEDRIEFTAHNGGDERLARFVCALELLHAKGKTSVPEAYAMATGCTLESAKKNAYGEYGMKHPAVEALLVRLRSTSRTDWYLRLQEKHGEVLTKLADRALRAGANQKDLQAAAVALSKFAQFVRADEAAERQVRSKRAASAARGALGKPISKEDITPETAGQIVQLLRETLGDHTLRELVGGAGAKAGSNGEAV